MTPQPQTKWLASEYLDNGKWGILTEDNKIIVGISAGLSKTECESLVKRHNEGEDVTLPQPQTGQAGASPLTSGQALYESLPEDIKGQQLYGWAGLSQKERFFYEYSAQAATSAAVREKEEEIAVLKQNIDTQERNVATMAKAILEADISLREKDERIKVLEEALQDIYTLTVPYGDDFTHRLTRIAHAALTQGEQK